MSKYPYQIATLVCALAVIELSAAWAAGVGAAVAQEATPAVVLGESSEGVAFEPIDRGTIDELLAITRLMRVTRVTLAPGASQATYTVLPAVYAVEEGTVAFDVDRQLPIPARLVRPASDGSLSRSPVVLPGTSLQLVPSDALAVPGVPDVEPPYASIFAGNRSDEPATYLDIEIFPTTTPHVIDASGDRTLQGLDVSLGLATAQESAPAWIVVDRLILQPGASATVSVDAPLLIVAQEGTVSLSVGEGEAALQRSGTRWGDAPESLGAGDSSDLTGNDATFLLPGTTGGVTNAGPAPLTALLVTILTPGQP